MQTRLAQKVNENTAQGEALFIESIRKVKNQVLVSSNLSEEKYNNYVQDFIDRNPSTTTGFKVSAGEYKEGDLIFDEIPNFASELMMANEPELVDELLFSVPPATSRSIICATLLIREFVFLFVDTSENVRITVSTRFTSTSAKIITLSILFFMSNPP